MNASGPKSFPIPKKQPRRTTFASVHSVGLLPPTLACEKIIQIRMAHGRLP